jgi:hypothetical protein
MMTTINVDQSLENYAFHRASALISRSNDSLHDREIGRVFAEYKDKLVIIDGDNKKEHEYLIPKTKVHRYGDNQVYFSISEYNLKEFEI